MTHPQTCNVGICLKLSSLNVTKTDHFAGPIKIYIALACSGNIKPFTIAEADVGAQIAHVKDGNAAKRKRGVK